MHRRVCIMGCINKDCLQNYCIVISVMILKFRTVRYEQIVLTKSDLT